MYIHIKHFARLRSSSKTNNTEMTIIGIGVDLVSIPRMRQLIQKNGERFLKRLFHDSELKERPHLEEQHAQYFASRWAAKEATVKALGKGGIGSKCMYITKSTTTPAPKLVLTGAAIDVLKEQHNVTSTDDYTCHVSLSHDGDYAVAMIVIEK
jgi:holo-[acyl-carrier protein] synthase